jgi:hypothetical protein
MQTDNENKKQPEKNRQINKIFLKIFQREAYQRLLLTQQQ